MDTLTHALSGALIGRATSPSQARISVRARVALGFAAAAFPDVDWVLGYVSPVAFLTGHRGVTHSILVLPIWALLIAWIAAKLYRRGTTWRDWFGVAALAIAVHIVGDLITSFGTMIFAPLSDARIAWNLTFIIDLWFTGIILAGLAISWVWRRSRIPAAAALVVLSGYVGFQAFAHLRAVEFGERMARTTGVENALVEALPRPVSPFNWMVVVTDGDRYQYTFINLLRDKRPATPGPDAGLIERLDAAYLPTGLAEWQTAYKFGSGSPQDRALAQRVWERPELGFFRWFSAQPVLYRIDRGNPSTCVWFEDLRFNTPGRGVSPFRFGLCQKQGDADWTAYRLLGESTIVPAR